MIGRDPAPLATEALRGEGATLINGDGERFMLALHPDAELAPRDIVARGVFAEIAAGRGAFLDAREAIGAHFAEKFPTVYASCIAAGIDPATQPIPVAPAAHYHMGGIAVDAHGRTSLDGLWAGGEVVLAPARTAPTGWPRTRCSRPWSLPRASPRTSPAAQFAAPARLVRGVDQPAQRRADAALAEPSLRAMMTSHVGVIRDGDRLAQARARRSRRIERDTGNIALRNMATTALLVAAVRLDAARKPRRALPLGLSGREPGAGAPHHDDARRRRARSPHRSPSAAPRDPQPITA